MAYRKIKKDGTEAKPTVSKHKPRGKSLKVNLEDFRVICDEYLKSCVENKNVPLTQELCLLLGISREAMSNYRKKPGYVDVIKRIDELQEIGWIRKAERENKPVLPIFMLKSKFNYVEAQYQKVDLNVSGQLGVVQMPSKKPKISAN